MQDQRTQKAMANKLIEAGKKLTDMGVSILTSESGIAEYEAVQIDFETGTISFITKVSI